jgi:hypothetical protein
MRVGEGMGVAATANQEFLSAWASYEKSGTFREVESDLFLDM